MLMVKKISSLIRFIPGFLGRLIVMYPSKLINQIDLFVYVQYVHTYVPFSLTVTSYMCTYICSYTTYIIIKINYRVHWITS